MGERGAGFFRECLPLARRLSFFRKWVQYRESKNGHVNPYAVIPTLTLPIEQTSPGQSEVIRAGTIQRTGLFSSSETPVKYGRAPYRVPLEFQTRFGQKKSVHKRSKLFKNVRLSAGGESRSVLYSNSMKGQATALHKRCGVHCHAPWSSACGRC